MSRRLPSSPLPYSKVCDLTGDAEQLAPFTATVDRYPDALQGQHAIRRWEYAMALRAIQSWQWTTWERAHGATEMPDPPSSRICDVGGAGSNFWQVLTSVTSEDIIIVDDKLESLPAGQVLGVRGTIEEAAAGTSPLVRHGQFDLLTCISVIEHVDELRKFFRACHMLLKPAGLLFLTTDYWNAEGEDTAHFHWMRKRIYNDERIRKLLTTLRELGFASFGQADWAYHGPQLYDYAVCSVAVTHK